MPANQYPSVNFLQLETCSNDGVDHCQHRPQVFTESKERLDGEDLDIFVVNRCAARPVAQKFMARLTHCQGTMAAAGSALIGLPKRKGNLHHSVCCCGLCPARSIILFPAVLAALLPASRR